MEGYLGVDVGSVSTKLVVLSEQGQVAARTYLPTAGEPIRAIQAGMRQIEEAGPGDLRIRGAGTTGSGRKLAAVVVGADVVKNEVTSQAVAASWVVPDVQTVLEIGGQDSKMIVIRSGVVIDFAMNTVCAAGTGSFLDRQAARLGFSIEEFGRLALRAKGAVRIAGRCAVFAESDMVHKQQMGHAVEDIVWGVCEALVRNYLNNVGKGKDVRPPIVFQGGVAANAGIRRAFEEAIGSQVIVPEHYDVMGAIGAALLAKEAVAGKRDTAFKGFETADWRYSAGGFECQGCPNGCEVVEISAAGAVLARWGDRCGRWSAGERSGDRPPACARRG